MTDLLLGTLEYGDNDGDGDLDFIEFISLMVAKDDLMVQRFRAPVISYWEASVPITGSVYGRTV